MVGFEHIAGVARRGTDAGVIHTVQYCRGVALDSQFASRFVYRVNIPGTVVATVLHDRHVDDRSRLFQN